MIKIGVVILARYNSSRLPGKALMCIQEKPVLLYIIERLTQVVPMEDILIATSIEESDNFIEEFAKDHNISCFRGSLNNVADRFFLAALSKRWDYVTRINGDNIFVDTNLLRRMIGIALGGEYDFISNVKDRTFPKGMSIEIIKVNFYKRVLPFILNDDDYKEHVTLYLYHNELGIYKFIKNKEVPEAGGIQMALDTPDDFNRSEVIVKHFIKPHWFYNLSEIHEIYIRLENE